MLNNFVNATKPNICVIGDLILDVYLKGDTNRISPESPIPIVNLNDTVNKLGGAGNCVDNLLTLGCEVSFISVVNPVCTYYNTINELLQHSKCNPILLPTNRKNTVKTRVVSRNQQIVRIDSEETTEIVIENQNRIFDKLVEYSENFDLVLLSDYNKGMLPKELVIRIIEFCNSKDIPVFIDPKGRDFDKYKNATLISPNYSEALLPYNLYNNETDFDNNIKTILNNFATELNIKIPLVTLSEKGISFLNNDKIDNIPTYSREVLDVSGAGDTVISALAYGYVIGENIKNCIKFANIAAGVVVAKNGTSTASLFEIEQYYEKHFNVDLNSKIICDNKKEGFIKFLNNSDKNIVFTNGCFDVLHKGHMKYLEESKKLGDILVVAIDSDESVKKLKGDNRPYFNLEDRMYALSCLQSVDYVLSFETQDLKNLISSIKPNIQTKGGDYVLEDIVGYGISDKIVIIDFVDGYSTTKIISDLKDI